MGRAIHEYGRENSQAAGGTSGSAVHEGHAERSQVWFSRNAVEALNSLGACYAHVNVLEAPFIREKLPSISQWPTYPQLFIRGELVGGSDVIVEMAREGSLGPLLADAGGL